MKNEAIKNIVKNTIKTVLNELTTPPTWERLKDRSGIKNYTNDNYKIVHFAYDDEGTNAFALLNMKKKKIIHWSVSGNSERSKFDQLN